MSHYIFIYQNLLSDEDFTQTAIESKNEEIFEHLVMLLAYHKSTEESTPVFNAVVFGTQTPMQELIKDFERYFRSHVDFVLVRILPLTTDSGYKPRSNVNHYHKRLEKLRNL
ncbi:MAG: hypothetical protein EHM58_01295 [Ignavibacteriae bacterium]|nr:MAG: hypothetical protein EHM58_01295 [Ignavibacteriota bacterium]